MRKVESTVTTDQITAEAKKGLNAAQAAKKLGLDYQQLYNILKRANIKYSDIAKEKTPQNKAWDTRKKQNAVTAYNEAPTSGLKASVARKFNAEFGINLKDYLATKAEPIVKVKEDKQPKVGTTKESFKQKELELMIPYSVKELINGLKNRVEALEKILMNK